MVKTTWSTLEIVWVGAFTEVHRCFTDVTDGFEKIRKSPKLDKRFQKSQTAKKKTKPE